MEKRAFFEEDLDYRISRLSSEAAENESNFLAQEKVTEQDFFKFLDKQNKILEELLFLVSGESDMKNIYRIKSIELKTYKLAVEKLRG